MPVVELIPYDILTADESRIMAPMAFWARLAQYARTGTARLLMVADNLRPEDVQRGFTHVAVPREVLPRRLKWYRQQYEEHLATAIQTTRVMKLYLILDSQMDGPRLAQLLGAYGIRAQPLRGEGIPLPFQAGELEWNRLTAEDGSRWALVESQAQQTGAFLPNVLHRLFALPFPIRAALDIYTYPNAEAVRLLRIKDASARYERADSTEQQARARDVRQTVAMLQAEMNRIGAALHNVRLAVLVGADHERELAQRLEIVRGSAGLALRGGESDAARIQEMFSPAPPRESAGSLLTSVGLTILASSALSYRRRTETRGVLLGTDRNQAPVILDLFDERRPSYNLVVLGQTGFGKSFSVLLLMLRHLLLGKRLIIIDPQGNIDLSWLGEDHHRAVLGREGATINILDRVHEELANQVEMVVAMLGLLGVADPRHPVQRAVLDRVLMDIYRPLWDRSIPPARMPTLREVQCRLAQLAGDDPVPDVRHTAALLSCTLTPYVSGSRAALFGQRTTVDFSLDHPVTVFDVCHLPREELGNLRTALLSILVGNISRSIRRRRAAGDTVQTMFFVDEIGVLMRDEVIAGFVSEQYKTARSRGVSMIVADQELTSLLGTADRRGMRHGRMMLATAITRLIFNQSGGDLPLVRDAFPDIPDEMVAALPHLQQGTCIAQMPDDLLLVDVQPSPFELAVLSSRLQDRARARRLIAQFDREARQDPPVPCRDSEERTALSPTVQEATW